MTDGIIELVDLINQYGGFYITIKRNGPTQQRVEIRRHRKNRVDLMA